MRTWTDGDLVKAVSKADSIVDVKSLLGLCRSGGGHALIKRHIARLGLSTAHFTRGASAYALRVAQQKHALTHEEIFREGSRVKSSRLAEYIRKNGLLPYMCELCGNQGNHNGQSLTLQIDHKNGESTDNRIENLRFLCPNCHSQTPTFAGRARKGVPSQCRTRCPQVSVSCAACGKPMQVPPSKARGQVFCGRACSAASQRRTPVMSAEALKELVWKHPVTRIAKDLGVSDTAVKKMCKKMGVSTPPRGYWTKFMVAEAKRCGTAL